MLKGPAAVLYGRGSQGGIVNRVSKAPEPGRRSTIEAQAGSEDLRSLYADLSADPSDTVSLRLNMGNQDNKAFARVSTAAANCSPRRSAGRSPPT